jgi:hypothetical protein
MTPSGGIGMSMLGECVKTGTLRASTSMSVPSQRGCKKPPTEELICRVIIKALKVPSLPGRGGRLGIAVDNGLLSNISREEPVVRRIVQQECIIEAIVGLPKGTFMPYGSNAIPYAFGLPQASATILPKERN